MRCTVGLFVPCMTDQLHPRVGVAVTRVLEYFGCDVRFPADQTCCGKELYDDGHCDEAAMLAKRMIAIFEGFDYVVTPSAGCCAMVRLGFPEMLAGDPAWGSGCRKLAASTYEVLAFLREVLKVDVTRFRLPHRRKVTYHQSCEANRTGTAHETMRILQGIGNVEYRATESPSRCCGFGGAFPREYPKMSERLLAQEVRAIGQTGADVVVSNETGCSLHLSAMSQRMGVTVEVKHVVELIADALRLNLDEW